MLQFLSIKLPTHCRFFVSVTLLLKAGATAHTAAGRQGHARSLDQAGGETPDVDRQ